MRKFSFPLLRFIPLPSLVWSQAASKLSPRVRPFVRVISALAVHSRLGSSRVVQYETDGDLALLERQLLKCKNVDILRREPGRPFQAFKVGLPSEL
jgi:hypothetical protein